MGKIYKGKLRNIELEDGNKIIYFENDGTAFPLSLLQGQKIKINAPGVNLNPKMPKQSELVLTVDVESNIFKDLAEAEANVRIVVFSKTFPCGC